WMLGLGLYYTGRRADARAVLADDARRFGRLAGESNGRLLLADDDLASARDALSRHGTPTGRPASLVGFARTLGWRAHVEFLAGAWDDAVLFGERAVMIARESEEASA